MWARCLPLQWAATSRWRDSGRVRSAVHPQRGPGRATSSIVNTTLIQPFELLSIEISVGFTITSLGRLKVRPAHVSVDWASYPEVGLNRSIKCRLRALDASGAGGCHGAPTRAWGHCGTLDPRPCRLRLREPTPEPDSKHGPREATVRDDRDSEPQGGPRIRRPTGAASSSRGS
jgi:hypothetical protein